MGFYEENKDKILNAMTGELKKLAGGSKTCSADLFSAIYPFEKNYVSEAELNKMYCDLFIHAKKEGLFLQSTEKGSSASRPYKFIFKVYQKKPGKMCPLCGKKDTVKITYGKIKLTDELKAEKKHHRLYILKEAAQELPAVYHCFSCRSDFGTPYAQEKEVTAISYEEICGIMNAVTIRKTTDGGEIGLKNGMMPEEAFPISEKEWKAVLRKLFRSLFVHEWKKEYLSMVKDGRQWTVKVTCSDQSTLKIYGNNAYPPYFPEFERWINKLKKER